MVEDKFNAILQVNPDQKGGKGKLAGKKISIKANICVKGLNASCASKVLENYKAPYDATVVEKIKNEGGIIIGMANCDEFASGSSGETSAFGPTKNPAAPGYIPGGSCSGSAASVAGNLCDMSLGSDTGGSIRNPASHCGVVGLKPSYGAVSRYGLIDLAMSTDTIGPFGKTVDDVALLFSVIQGRDSKDSISVGSKFDLSKVKEIPKDLTVGVLDLEDLKVDPNIKDILDSKTKEIIEKYGWKFKKVKLKHLDLAVETYYPIIYVEAFSASRKLDGRRFGKKVEEAAGPEYLRRVLGGNEITKAEHSGRYYNLALRAKKLISDEFENIFKGVDCIISPVVPFLPWKIGDKISVEEVYASDALTTPSSLAGNCAISIPVGNVNSIPVGMQIICDKFQEQKLLQIARSVEKL